MKNFKVTQSITDRSDICLKSYLKDINKYPLIDQDEEKRLSNLIKQGDKRALDKLVNSNLRFVVSVAKQYQNKTLSLIDLINEGNIGLIKAAEKFEPERGFKFISYAVWWIRQAIIQSISDKAKTIRVPSNQGALITKVNKLIAQFEQQHDRIPSNEEIAEMANITEDKVSEIMSIVTRTVSVDTPFSDEEENCLLDVIPNRNSPLSDADLDKQSFTDGLNLILRKLSCREYDIIQMTFGLNGIQEMNFEEIGKRFGLTGERVRQIKEKCLKDLKAKHAKELKCI